MISTVKGLAGMTSRAVAESSAESAAQNEGRDAPRSGEVMIIESGAASELAAPSRDDRTSGLYSYIDSNGGAHMVRGLQNVPAQYRGGARSLSGGGGPVINRYDAEVTLTKRRRFVPASVASNPNRGDVTLFSAEWCGACRKAKSFLDQRGVDYALLDIDDDPAAKEEVRRVLGSVRIPLLDIDGTYVAGYDPGEIGRLLDQI